MPDQGDVIKRIDHDSGLTAKTLRGVGGESRIAIIFRLLFLPAVCFIRSMVSGKGLPDRPSSLYDCINEAALVFITEAKRYEIMYSDKVKPAKDSRDFR